MMFPRVGFVAGWIIAGAGWVASAQQTSLPLLHAIAELPPVTDGLVLHRFVHAGEPFTVAGPQGVIVGQQEGVFEAWILPIKLLSHLTLEADVAGYSVPLDLNSMAREIEVRPGRTTITYSHIAVTVRQTMFAPEESPSGAGTIVLFQIDAVRPVTLTVRFTPELREMWPKSSSGTASAEWLQEGVAASISCIRTSRILLPASPFRAELRALWLPIRSGRRCIRWN
jgi:hypothetical protein